MAFSQNATLMANLKEKYTNPISSIRQADNSFNLSTNVINTIKYTVVSTLWMLNKYYNQCFRTHLAKYKVTLGFR